MEHTCQVDIQYLWLTKETKPSFITLQCFIKNILQELFEYAEVIAKENGVEAGEQILITAGTPGVKGATSHLELITVK
jgi:hypothetical protein